MAFSDHRRRLLAGAALVLGAGLTPGLAAAAGFDPPPLARPGVETPTAPPPEAKANPPEDKPFRVNLMGRFGVDLPPKAVSRLQTSELARDHAFGLDGLTLKPGPASDLRAADLSFPVPGSGPFVAPSPRARGPFVVAMAENGGGEEARPWRAGATIVLPGAVHPEDLTRLGLFHGLANDKQWGAHLSTTQLLNPHGLGFHADLVYFHFAPSDRVPPSDNTQILTTVARAELDQALFVRGADFAGLRAGLEIIEQDEDVVATRQAVTRDRLRYLFAGATTRLRRGETYAEADLQVRKGIAVFGATRPGAPLLSHSDAQPQAWDLRAAVKAGHPLLGGIIEARVRGQWARTPLPIFENFVYQGFEPARAMDPMALRTDHALDPRVLRADCGVSGGVEYSRTAAHILGGTLSPFVFAEHAETWNLGLYGAKHGSATLAGGGLRLALPRRLDAELEYSAPTAPVQGLFSTDHGKPRLLFTIARRFGG